MHEDLFEEILKNVWHQKCRTCKVSKPYYDFSVDNTKVLGRTTLCKTCYSEYHKANAEKINARRKELHGRTKERSAAYYKIWYKNNPEKVKNKSLEKYGLTLETFNNLVEQQNGLCKICNETLIARRHTHVDHCHRTGVVRGILCHTCNTKLGWFEKHQAQVLVYLKDC